MVIVQNEQFDGTKPEARPKPFQREEMCSILVLLIPALQSTLHEVQWCDTVVSKTVHKMLCAFAQLVQ